MTTIPFQPNNADAPPFQTQVTLDGNGYTLTTMWNVYRQDWYFQLQDQYGNLVINAPLIGSPPTSNIPLAPGIFTTNTLLYRPSTGNFEVLP